MQPILSIEAVGKRPRCRGSHPGDPNSRRIDLSRPSEDASKVVCNHRGRALYFFRAARSRIIATVFPRSGTAHRSAQGDHLHLGLYAFPTSNSCSSSGSLPPSPLEAAEKLEQLRVLDAGYPIAVGMVDEPSVGIDTPEDYKRFVARWRASHG